MQTFTFFHLLWLLWQCKFFQSYTLITETFIYQSFWFSYKGRGSLVTTVFPNVLHIWVIRFFNGLFPDDIIEETNWSALIKDVLWPWKTTSSWPDFVLICLDGRKSPLVFYCRMNKDYFCFFLWHETSTHQCHGSATCETPRTTSLPQIKCMIHHSLSLHLIVSDDCFSLTLRLRFVVFFFSSTDDNLYLAVLHVNSISFWRPQPLMSVFGSMFSISFVGHFLIYFQGSFLPWCFAVFLGLSVRFLFTTFPFSWYFHSILDTADYE